MAFVLFNKHLDTGYFPSFCAEVYIDPLHKNCDINNVHNYNGITLLTLFSVLGKLCFTFSMLNNILNEMYQVYIEAQTRFRKLNMSTVDNIFVLHELNTLMLNGEK